MFFAIRLALLRIWDALPKLSDRQIMYTLLWAILLHCLLAAVTIVISPRSTLLTMFAGVIFMFGGAACFGAIWRMWWVGDTGSSAQEEEE
jgi:hypothetical protein